MVVDIHTHAFADPMAASAMRTLEAEAGFPGSFDGTVSGLLEQMDAAGIDVSVVQPVATKPTQVPKINEWAASIETDTAGRVIGFGAMHPDIDDPSAEIARMADAGIKGFKMHPEYQGFVPDEPRLDRVLDAATEAGMVVLFHAGADIALPTTQGTPAAFSRMAQRHPELRVVLAHMGGYGMWDDVATHLAGTDVYLDTAYTLGHLPDDEFVSLVRTHGAHRVLFGTDTPWTRPKQELARLRALPLTAEEIDFIVSANAAELLGLGTV